ncbi:S24 family peptidase [Aliarcobacter butzleri]|uniref:S24 family peptidase n=1 Tax=Aliarcobacter butzleri TaxID=28197 RepID=UPI002B25074C|nr:S24 family peptidase [Aliarcobacter butzleri]
MKIGEKVKIILEEKNLKQIDLIRYLLGKQEIEGSERTKFSRYFSGIHEFPNEYIVKTAMFLKVDPKVLLSNSNQIKGMVNVQTKIIPIVGSSGCSVPCESYFKDFYDDTDETTYYSGNEEFVYAIRAFGDSMETYINDGDICFFEILKNNGIKDGEVVHYSFDYGSDHQDINGIKVYKIREDGSVYLKPLNGKYDIIEVKDKSLLRASRLLNIQKAAMRF